MVRVRPKKNAGSGWPRSHEVVPPGPKVKSSCKGQAGQYHKGSTTLGCARTSLHPGLLSCHHSVVRRRRFGVGAM